MRTLKSLVLPVFLCLLLWPIPASADGFLTNLFISATPGTSINNIGTAIAFHKMTWNVSGTVTGCTVALDTSVDGVTWSAGGAIAGQTCTSNGNSTVANVVANYVRINMTAFTGTGSVSVTWNGYVNNPSGGGGTIGGSIANTQVAFGTAANTIGGNAGFIFVTPNLTIPVNGSYNIGSTPMLSTPPSGGTPGNNISVGGPSNMSAITNTAVNNLAVGSLVMTLTTTGQGNTAVGIGALQNEGATNQKNTAIGHAALAAVTSDVNTALGDSALTTLTSGGNNVAIGGGAGGNATTGSNNTLLGSQAGLNLSTGGSNIIIGTSQGSAISSGSSNLAIGVAALSNITATASNQMDIMDVLVGTGMNVPATSTVEFKGNVTVDGTCTGCAGSLAFPVTVSGGVSGAVPCFTSTTALSAGTLLASHAITQGGGAGACPTTGNGDFTIDSTAHTFKAGASGLVDLTAITGTNGFGLPSNSSCGPSTNGFLCYSTANNSFEGKTGGVAAILMSTSTIVANNTIPKSGSGGQSFYVASSIIDNGTTVSTTEPVNAGAYQTATNCAANGTAANPSVVSCGSAAAGMVSCATAASTGTCQVNTTRVTANSEISITQNAADGTPLSVTCNTGNVLSATAPVLASKSAGTSFTINLGTVATNPACFEYTIVN